MRPSALVLAAGLVLASVRADAASPADARAARELVVEAAAASLAGEWQRAREAYARSVALDRSAAALHGLGVAQAKLGLLVEAIESFRLFLLEAPPDDADRAAVKTRLDALELRVGSLELVVIRPSVGARVEIDGTRVPTSVGGATRVNPGRHVVTARADGHEPLTKTVEVGEGKKARVEIELKRTATTPVAVLPEPPARAQTFVAGAVVASVGLGVFVVGLGVALSGPFEGGRAPAAQGALSDDARLRFTVGDVICAGGLAIVIGGVVALAVESTRKGPEPAKTRALRGTLSF